MRIYEQENVTEDSERSPKEEYDLVKRSRLAPEDVPDTEMDEEEVK